MASDDTLNLLIRSALDSSGFDQFQQKIKQAEAGATRASASAKDFSASIQDLGTKLLAAGGITLGLAEAFTFLKGSISAAVEESRALDQMRAVNESLAGATQDSRAANVAWLQSVEAASGKTKEELIPSYVRLAAVTGSVSEAQRITQIAAGAAARGYGELGQITQALIKYYETGTAPIRGFGAVLTALVKGAADVSQGFNILTNTFGDAGEGTDNLGIKVDRLKVAWHDLKAEMGAVAIEGASGVKKFFEGVDKLLRDTFATIGIYGPLLTKLKADSAKAAAGLNTDAAAIAGGIKETERLLKAQADAYDLSAQMAKNASRSTVDGIKAELAVYKQMAHDPDFLTLSDDKAKAAMTAKVIALEKQLTNELQSETRKRALAAKEQEAAVKEQYTEEIKSAKVYSVSTYDQLLQEIAIYKRMAAEKGVSDKFRLDALEKLKKAQQDLEKEEEKELKTLTSGRTLVQFLKETEDDRMKQVRKDTAERIKLDLMEDKMLKDMSISELQNRRATLEAELKLEGITAEEIIRIRQKMAAITIQINKTWIAETRAAADATIAIATAAFGQNKALAIAQAVINAALAVINVFAQEPPVPTWLAVLEAAAVAATTAAQIATIESATPGSGGTFDDPVNDFSALVGGRKSAKDLVEYFGSGFSQALIQAGGSTSSVSNISNRGGDRHVHITINGGVLGNDDVAARQLVKRIMPIINNLDRQRTLR